MHALSHFVPQAPTGRRALRHSNKNRGVQSGSARHESNRQRAHHAATAAFTPKDIHDAQIQAAHAKTGWGFVSHVYANDSEPNTVFNTHTLRFSSCDPLTADFNLLADGGANKSITHVDTLLQIADPGTITGNRVVFQTAAKESLVSEYKAACTFRLERQDGTHVMFTEPEMHGAYGCPKSLLLLSENSLLRSGFMILKKDNDVWITENGEWRDFDDPRSIPLDTQTAPGLAYLKGSKMSQELNAASVSALRASEPSRVYSATAGDVYSESNGDARGKENRVFMWQARFGFPHPEQLGDIIEHTVGHGLTKSDVLKYARKTALRTAAFHRRKPARSKSQNKTPRNYQPFESFSMDLQEYTKSTSGNKFSVDFVEDKTGVLYSAYVKDKNAETIVLVISTFRSYIMTRHNAVLKHIWSDNESALLSEVATLYLAKNDIFLQTSPPHQHYKNAKVERLHGPLRRLTTVLLHSGRLPIRMWPVAHAMAVKLINITPTSRHPNRMSPLQMANNGAKPDVSRHRKFGCPVSVLNAYTQRTDGKLNGFMSIYLGPDPRSPEADMVLNEAGNRIISSNVRTDF